MMIHTPKTIYNFLQTKREVIKRDKPFEFEFTIQAQQNLESQRATGPQLRLKYKAICPEVYTDPTSGEEHVSCAAIKLIGSI